MKNLNIQLGFKSGTAFPELAWGCHSFFVTLCKQASLVAPTPADSCSFSAKNSELFQSDTNSLSLLDK